MPAQKQPNIQDEARAAFTMAGLLAMSRKAPGNTLEIDEADIEGLTQDLERLRVILSSLPDSVLWNQFGITVDRQTSRVTFTSENGQKVGF